MSHGRAHPDEVRRLCAEAEILARSQGEARTAAGRKARFMASTLTSIRDEMQLLRRKRTLVTVRFIDAALQAGWETSEVAHTVRELGGS